MYIEPSELFKPEPESDVQRAIERVQNWVYALEDNQTANGLNHSIAISVHLPIKMAKTILTALRQYRPKEQCEFCGIGYHFECAVPVPDQWMDGDGDVQTDWKLKALHPYFCPNCGRELEVEDERY